MDGGAWNWKTAVHGVAEGWTQLSDFTFTFHFHALEKEMATYSSVLAWRIPGTGEPGGLLSMGSHRVGQDWSDLAAAAVAQRVKRLPAVWENWVQSPGQDHALENEMASHSSTLAWKIPWTEKPAWPKATGKQSIASKGPSSQSYGFSSHVWMYKLDSKESWASKNWCFWTVVLKKTLESPLDSKEIQPVHPEGNQSWTFIGKTDVETETPILWPHEVKYRLLGEDPDAGKDWRWEEKGMTEDEMVGWHHRCDEHELE